MRRLVILLGMTSASIPAMAQDSARPNGRWTVAEGLSMPESVYYDGESKTLFISNMAGASGEKDGQGWITKADATGKVIDAQWVKGLNAPKGMRSYKGTLWVSDIDALVAIDIKSGKTQKRIEIEGSKFLDDVAIDDDGSVYVSDMTANKIYQVKGGKAAVFLADDELAHPNGLLVHEDELVIASWGTQIDPTTGIAKTPGHLQTVELSSKRIATITRRPLGNLDGVELDGSGGYLVSDWLAGRVYRVTAGGEATVVLDGFKGAADLAVIEEKNLLVVPRMLENKVAAYALDEL